MKKNSIFLALLLLGCSYTPIKKNELDNLNELRSKSIIDATSIVDFDKEDSLVIVDSLSFSKLEELVKRCPRKIKIIYLAREKDRLYLNALQYRSEQLLKYFVAVGGNTDKLEASIGLDYHTKYKELKNSSIVLLIK